MTRGKYAWADVVDQARAAKGKWTLPNTLMGVPTAARRSITDRRHPDLHIPDGRLEADATNAHRTDDGKTLCDIWVRFIPQKEVTA